MGWCITLQVQQMQEESSKLQASYAGDKAGITDLE